MVTPHHPIIRDPEMFQDFVDSLTDQIPNVERDIAKLKQTPDDRSILADLFRAIHTLKGDASLCKLELGVRIAHPIESLLARLREGKLVFTDLFGEALLLALDRLELAVDAIAHDKPLNNLHLERLVLGLDNLAEAGAKEINQAAATLIESVTGFRPASLAAREPQPQASVSLRPDEATAADLQFFHSLAQQFESRSPLYQGRSARLLKLALETNQEAGKPVDPTQLAAAVYMHDVGMMFLPESVWLKEGRLSDEDRATLALHPSLGAGLLGRMEGWHGAAEMVAQHHEMPDGTGYPRGLKGAQICPGACILAIVDAFEAVTLKHSQRGQTRSLLRAIAEVNACDSQFAAEWVAPFNAVIRRQLDNGQN